MKISKKDAQLLIILAGVLLFVGLYFGVHSTFQTKTTEVQTEIDSLMPELQALREHAANLEMYQEETAEAKEYAKEQLALYPAGIKEEDFLVWLLDFEDNIAQDISTVSFSQPSMMSEFNAYVEVNGQSTFEPVTAYSVSSAISTEFGYDTFKQGLDYIYNSPYRTSLESVSLSYSAETALLAASMNLNKYYITYPSAEYVQSPMPQVPIGGIANLFGTASITTP